MTAFSSKYNVRSISMPARSHPITIKIEQELNKLKLWEANSFSNSDLICNGLSGLGQLYHCIEDLLNSPMTQQTISRHQTEKWVGELIDGSIRFLDLCSKSRETVVVMKELVHELQSAIRRSKGGKLSIQDSLKTYICTRKNIKKEMAKSLSVLKHTENKFGASTISYTDNYLFSAVFRVLNEANLTTISIFESLVLFLAVPMLKPKVNRWPLVSKLVHKGRVSFDNGRWETTNELESVDIALSDISVHNSSIGDEAEKIQSAHEKLEALGVCMEGIENGLECLFKHMIHTRVSLLNILSQ